MFASLSFRALARAAATVLALVAMLTTVSIVTSGSADAAIKKRHNGSEGWARKSYVGAKVDHSEDASPSITGSHKSHRRYANTGGHRAKYAKSRNVRVASLGDEVYTPRRRGHSRSVAQSGSGNIVWSAPSGCLNGTLRSALSQVSHVASIRVNSTCRSRSHNAAVGGARHSHHLTGDAVDFRVLGGNSRAVYAMLRANGSLGGIKHYGGGLYHIDTGPRRSW